MKRICVYGKGGIGKSTVVSNLAAAMAEQGKKAAVVGCDPKADSTRNLTRQKIPTVLDCILKKQEPFHVFGYGGVLCIESGGPEPGTGCAGRGITAALEAIREKELLYDRDVVIFDVLGDVVCGGFSAPMREQAADQVYLVTTADYMSLYAANNICKGICRYAASGEVRLSGIIQNCRCSLGDHPIVEEFAARIGSKVIGKIPMTREISLAEMRRRTIIEAFPEHPAAGIFMTLAEAVWNNNERIIPRPLDEVQLEQLYHEALCAVSGTGGEPL